MNSFIPLLLVSLCILNSSHAADPRQEQLELLTPQRIAALPEPDRALWTQYIQQSHHARTREFEILQAECEKLGVRESRPAPGNQKEFELDSKLDARWFQGEEARRIGEAIISYQTPTGGWSKAVDYTPGPRQPGTHWTSQKGERWHYCGTLDNRTTTEQIKYLAHWFTATQRADARDAALKGIDWLLQSQFPTGGWPQNYPLESGYHEAATLNDDAHLHALELLLSVVQSQTPYEFVDSERRTMATRAWERGFQFLVKAQVRVNGQSTVWAAQHDPLTLEPVGARKKEPPSLSGAESANIVKFLMRTAPISPQSTDMIETALAWFDAHRLKGLKKTKNAAGKTDYISDPRSSEVYWARFYDVQSGQPMFAGAQDGIVYSTFSEMASKNKVGYDYFTTRPGELLDKEHARWKKRLEKEKP